MLDALNDWFHHFVDQRIYPVTDVNQTGVQTYNIAGHECILKVRDDALCWIIYVHGNAVTLDTLNRARIVDNFVLKSQCNVIAPAYPAKTQTGQKYDNLVAGCVASVYNKIMEDSNHVGDTNVPIFFVGRSLGVAIALKACERVKAPPKGIVCISGFDCIQARIPKRYSALSCFVGDRFNNIQSIASDKLEHVNKLIIHGTNDLLIPLSCARDLKNAAGKAELEVITGMEHDIRPSEWESIYSIIHKFTQPPEQRNILCPEYKLWHTST